jgi:deoxyribonuclease-4
MLRFAVAGSPLSTPAKGGTLEGIKRAHALGIRAMEIEWVQRVPNNPKHMEEIKQLSRELDIILTCHAPYFINLNAKDPLVLEASIERILLALEMAERAGIRSVCVHPAFYLGMDPEVALANVRLAVARIMEKKQMLFPHVNLGLETMGKVTQFGTLEEVLIISKEFDLYPVIDPAHMHARTNGLINSVEEWNEMFDLYEKYLGAAALKNVHMHYSGIAYTAKGERHHLPLEESDAKSQDRRNSGLRISFDGGRYTEDAGVL